jgi:SDR family mycofactocin-dependent oxidoreductase
MLITGAAHGQGRSHAVRLARDGADVIVTDLGDRGGVDVGYSLGSNDELLETARLVEQTGRRAFAGTADVRDRAALQRVLEDTAADFPRLDVIVANAGISTHGRFLDIEPSQWNQIIDINLTGVFNTIQIALPRMLAAGHGGSIIIVSSVAGLKGLPFFAGYTAAKHGTQGLMTVLAQELAEHSIRVNSVNPGPVATAMNQNDVTRELFTDDTSRRMFRRSFSPMLPLPKGGYMESEHVSDAVSWLASDESTYVTGMAIPVDAGMLVR